MSPRAHGNSVRKVCGCGWRRWPKCGHPWYFSYKPREGQRCRFSFDAEFGGHIASKVEAEKKAATIRAAIDGGTFERTADRRARQLRDAEEQRIRAAAGVAPSPSTVTLDQFATTYVTRGPQASGKSSWKDDEYLLATIRNHRTVSGQRLGDYALSAITEDELEAFHAAQRAAGRAASTLNHLVQVMKAAFRWAVRKGYLPRSPISDESALKRSKMSKRTRRLPANEEAALLAVANPRWVRLFCIHWFHVGLRMANDVGTGRVLTS